MRASDNSSRRIVRVWTEVVRPIGDKEFLVYGSYKSTKRTSDVPNELYPARFVLLNSHRECAPINAGGLAAQRVIHEVGTNPVAEVLNTQIFLEFETAPALASISPLVLRQSIHSMSGRQEA